MREYEVTARVVRDISVIDGFEALATVGVFAHGTDQNGSGVWRCLVMATNEEEACRAVTSAMLSFPDLVVHDVRPGPYEQVSETDDAEEERFDQFLSRLDESCAREVMRRVASLHGLVVLLGVAEWTRETSRIVSWRWVAQDGGGT